MSLRLEDEPSAEPARPAPPQRGEGGELWTLALLGFRNDLARHRVLSLLRKRGELPSDDPPLPCTLHERIDRQTGERLAADLDELGAVLRLTPVDEAVDAPPQPQAAAVAPSAVAVDPPAVPRRLLISARGVRLLVFVGIGVAWAIRLLRPDPEVVVPFPVARPAARPASARAEPARAATAHIRQLIDQGDLAGAHQAIDRLPEGGADAAAQALRGDVHSRQGDWDAARAAYERADDLGSRDPQVFLALAGIYRQQGKQTAAVEMLHRAQQHGASGRDFEMMKQVVVAEQDAESTFGSVDSPHFTVSFDAGEDYAAAQLILGQLEDAYLVVGHKLGQYPSHRTPAVLYAAQDFQRVTHSPGWAGALYDGRIKVPVRGLHSDTPDLAGTIRHEYAHALIMSLSGGRCPVWLNEGVAMWAEDEHDGERAEWAFGAMQAYRPMTLAQLETSFGRLSPQQAVAAYARSYLAVRYIVARYGERALQNLLTAFATSATTADAFRAALPIELSSFEDELRREQEGS